MESNQQRRQTAPNLPQNTLVVMPKAGPASRSALWALFWTLGVLMGLFVREFVNEAGGTVGNAGAAGLEADAAQVAGAAPTMELNVRAVLELPSPTPTSSPIPAPTKTPEATPPGDFCSDQKPGAVCQVPYPPPPTPTPFPSCAEMAQLSPGSWCVWPTATPAGNPPAVAQERLS